MKIAHVLASPFFGGPERQALGVARAMRPEANSVFLTMQDGPRSAEFDDEARSAGFEVHPLRNNWPHMLRCRREIADFVRSLRCDVVCTHGYKPDILGWMAARAARVPAVSVAHGWTGATWKVRLNEWLDRQVMKRFDRVIGVSAMQSRRVRRAGVADDRIVTVLNAVDPDAMGKSDSGLRQQMVRPFKVEPTMLWIAAGRLSPEKGVDQLIDAFAMVRPRVPTACLLVYGDGPLRESLLAEVKKRDLQHAVHFAGHVRDLERRLPQADGFVLPSRTEGLPVILLEAMAAGVVPVAFDVGGIGEVIADFQDGRLIEAGNIEALADAMVRVSEDEAERGEMSEAARSKIDARFTHADQATAYIEVFRSAMQRPS